MFSVSRSELIWCNVDFISYWWKPLAPRPWPMVAEQFPFHTDSQDSVLTGQIVVSAYLGRSGKTSVEASHAEGWDCASACLILARKMSTDEIKLF